MKQCFLVLLSLFAVSCAPTIVVRRERPPAIMLPGRSVSIQPYNSTTGQAFVDVLRAIVGASAMDRYSDYAANRVQSRVVEAQAGYAVLAGCMQPCPNADATLVLQVQDARADAIKMEKGDKEQRYEGHATVMVSVIGQNRVIAFQRQYTGSYTGTGDVITTSVRLAADKVADAVLPRWESDSFVLAKEGPLKEIAKLAADGKLDAAEQQLRAYATQNPGEPFGRFHLGAVLTARGQLEAALSEFQAAAQVSSEYVDEVADAQQRIQDRDALRAFRGQ